MKVLVNIFIESSEYFALVAGALGVGLFLAMFLTLDFLRNLGKLFNRAYSVKEMEKAVNKRQDIEKGLYAQSKIISLIIIISSIYVLIFLYFKLDLDKIITILAVKSTMKPFTLALLQTAKLFSYFSFITSLIFGVILLIDKGSAEKISDFLSNWYSTEELESKLDDAVFKDTDTICFLHNKFIGFLGLAASLILMYFAISNIISK